jgi:predicted DNA-binding protein YlxM (UPF0122 family)
MNWSYIAAFLDGEGSIMIDRRIPRIRISITNTNKDVMEEICKFVGFGKVYCIQAKNRKKQRQRKDQYWFSVNSHEDAIYFLKKVMRFLIVKREKAKEALEFAEKHRWSNLGKLRHVSKEELIDLYCNKGMTLKQIADKFGVSVNAIWCKMKRLEIPRRVYPLKLDFASKDELTDLYWNKGLSLSEIAKKFGVDGNTVQRRMKEFNIPTKPFRHYKSQRVFDLRAERLEVA